MRTTQVIDQKSSFPSHANSHPNFNLPNSLTIFRIVLIPVFMVVFLSPSWYLSILPAFLFALAGLTDLLDGYLARRNNQITNLGRLLDPIADKLLVLSGLILLVQFHRIEAWLAVAIIAREVAVSGLRSIAAIEGLIISADNIGKYKAFFQVLGIVCLTLPSPIPYFYLDIHEFGQLTLYLALGLGIVSGVQYAIWAFHSITPRNPSKYPI